jgi:hypothetical protein
VLVQTPVLLLLGFLVAVVAPNEIGTPAVPAIGVLRAANPAGSPRGLQGNIPLVPSILCLPLSLSTESEPGRRAAFLAEVALLLHPSGSRMQV